MNRDPAATLRQHGIAPTAQRLAVARYVLETTEHPSADQVWSRVKKGFPQVSRATIYNTLNLFVHKGILKQLLLAEGKVVFDPKVDRHHHFVDDATGRIHDVPWDALEVRRLDTLPDIEVSEYQVILRGRKHRR